MTDVKVVLSEDPRDFQRRDWNALVERDPHATVFHTPEFLKIYWEEFGERPGHLLLAFGETDTAEQVAAAAFEVVDGVLRFLGGTEITDFQGPVGLPEARTAFSAGLWEALMGREDWREADLGGLSEDSAWLPAIRDAASELGLDVREESDRNGVAPLLELPPTWDAYLEQLPSKLRHEIRRKAKKLASESGPYEIERASPASVDGLLDRFVELHRMSEGPKGVFMVPGMEIFFRRLGQTLCERGVFRLSFIRVAGELAAGTIGFRFKSTYSLYNSAFDRAWQSLAPGMVLVAEAIRGAIEEGCDRFDLLKGDYAYKYRFGARRRLVKRLSLSR